MIKSIFLLSNFICVLSFAANSPTFSPTGEPKSSNNSNTFLDETLEHESFDMTTFMKDKRTQVGPAAQSIAPATQAIKPITPATSMLEKALSSITNLFNSALTLSAPTKRPPRDHSSENDSSAADEVELSDVTDFDPNTSLDKNDREKSSLNTEEEAMLTSLLTERAQAPTQEIESRNSEISGSTPEELSSLDTSFNSPPVLLLGDFYAGKITPVEKVRPAPGETPSTREPANTPGLASSTTASPPLTTSPENDHSNGEIDIQTPQNSAAPGEATIFMTTVEHQNTDTSSLDYSGLTEIPLTFSLATTLHETTLTSINKEPLSLNVSSVDSTDSGTSFLSKTSTNTPQDEHISKSLSLCDVSSIEVVLSEGTPSDLSDFNDFNFNETLDEEESLVPTPPPAKVSAASPTAADATLTKEVHLARLTVMGPEQAISVMIPTPAPERTDAATPTQSPTRITTPVENQLTPTTLLTPREAIKMPAPLNIPESTPIPTATANLNDKRLLSPAPSATATHLIIQDGAHQQPSQDPTANPKKQSALTRRSIGAGALSLLAAAIYQHVRIVRLEEKLKNEGHLNQQESAQLNTLQKWRLGSGIGSGVLLGLTAYLYSAGKEKSGGN